MKPAEKFFDVKSGNNSKILNCSESLLNIGDTNTMYVLGSSTINSWNDPILSGFEANCKTECRSVVIANPAPGKKGLVAVVAISHRKGSTQYYPYFLEINCGDNEEEVHLDLKNQWMPPKGVFPQIRRYSQGLTTYWVIEVKTDKGTFTTYPLFDENSEGMYLIPDGDLICKFLVGELTIDELMEWQIEESDVNQSEKEKKVEIKAKKKLNPVKLEMKILEDQKYEKITEELTKTKKELEQAKKELNEANLKLKNLKNQHENEKKKYTERIERLQKAIEEIIITIKPNGLNLPIIILPKTRKEIYLEVTGILYGLKCFFKKNEEK